MIPNVATEPNKLPFGTLPRLLLAWVCSEAVRLQSRELVLGRSLYEFMRRLGKGDRSGSVRGDRTRLKNQMRRLFACTVTLVYENAQREVRVSSLVADRTEFWWDAKQPDAPVLWDSKIELGEKFFQEIITHPIPLDLTTLKALKRSPLGLDLYFWLVYRTFALKAPLRLSWRQLYRQFGSNPAKASDTRTEAAKSIKLIRQMSRVANREIPYAAFFARKSAAIREKTFRDIETQFAAAGVPVLECPLIDRAAYRSMFSFGGTIRTIDATQVSGLPGARENAQAFVQDVLSKLSKARAIA